MKAKLALFIFLTVLIGQNYPQFLLNHYTPNSQAAIAIRGANEIFSIGNSVLCYSPDAGTTWAQTSAPSLVNTIYPFGDKNIYAGTSSSLYLSKDNGINWTNVRNVGPANVNGYCFLSAKKIFAYGGSSSTNPFISVSIDSGLTFTSSTFPLIKPISSMFFVDSLNGFCGCPNGQFLNTTNGGTSWSLIYTGPTSVIQKIYFIDKLNGWAAGSGGFLLKTTDGGLNWTSSVNSLKPTWSGMKFFDSQNGIICGDNFILRTTNGGTDWTTSTSELPASTFKSAIFTSMNTGWFAGDGIYKYDMVNPGITLTAPVPGTVWQSGTQNTVSWLKSFAQGTVSVFLSTNDGVNWTSIAESVPGDSTSVSVTAPILNSRFCKIKVVVNSIPSVTGFSESNFTVTVNLNWTTTTPNQITQYFSNIGLASFNPIGSGTSGLFWPTGTYKTAIFEDGILWAGKVNGDLRCGGSTYRSGLQPGNIVSTGVAADPLLPDFNIWKIRKDWSQLPPGAERNRYEYNVQNWPVNLGAPYDDLNHDGVYTPGIDAPKYIGDETSWYVANDLDPARTTFLYGTQPIGVEMQLTEYGFNTTALKDVLFRDAKLINKSTSTVTDMYFTIWSDPDLGYAGDDFIGCDTLLNLGYAYNGSDMDGDGNWATYGAHPPAVGYQVVQGPIIPGLPADSAFSGGRYLKGKKNIPMNSFIDILKGWGWDDPNLGVVLGAQHTYNYIRGKTRGGDSIVNPVTNLVTTFLVSGDPVAGTGWYEGTTGWPGGPASGDRRLMMSFGPFNFAPGDTQVFSFATLLARGGSNLESITALKNLCGVIKGELQHIYTGVTDASAIPANFRLEQNYPNPFNPSTTISYALPVESKVKIVIYNSLGQTVREVLNSVVQSSGNKTVTINAGNLSSGVYFYSVSAKSLDGKQEFRNVKKMVVLK